MIKVIPEYVARVPVWVEGMFAGRCVYDRNRSQQFAAVRNGSCEGRMAVHMVSSATGVTFGGFQRRVASFRVAGVALWTWPSSFCVAGAALLRSRVVVFADRIVRATSSGDNVQILWQA